MLPSRSSPSTGTAVIRHGLRFAVVAVFVFACTSSAAARTLIAEPQGIEAGPTLAGNGVAWGEGSFGRAIELQIGGTDRPPQTVARFADPEGKNVFQYVNSFAGSETDLMFIRGTFRSVVHGDSGTAYNLGAELFSGSPEGPFAVRSAETSTDGSTCSEEGVELARADLDSRTVALLERIYPCVDGRISDPVGRLSTIDLASGARKVLDEQPFIYAPDYVRIEGAYVAWGRHVGPRFEDVVTVYDHIAGSEVYSVGVETGVSAIDIQADGKLAAMRGLLRKDGLHGARAVPVWFSTQEPYEHPLPFRASDTGPIEISGDRLVLERLHRDRPIELVTSTIEGASRTIAPFTGTRRLAAGRKIDFNGSYLTYAESRRTDDGRALRIYVDDVSGES